MASKSVKDLTKSHCALEKRFALCALKAIIDLHKKHTQKNTFQSKVFITKTKSCIKGALCKKSTLYNWPIRWTDQLDGPLTHSTSWFVTIYLSVCILQLQLLSPTKALLVKVLPTTFVTIFSVNKFCLKSLFTNFVNCFFNNFYFDNFC